MGSLTTQPVTSRSEWEEFLADHPEGNFLQSWQWGEFHERLGNRVHRTGFFRAGKLVGVMLSVVENARRARYLTVPGGPILDWRDRAATRAAFGVMRDIGESEQCAFVRVRPQLVSDAFSRETFRANGFRDAPMHLHAELTSQLYIARSEDELLRGMRKTTRYEIRRAIDEDVRVEATRDEKAITAFYAYQLDTAKRQGFVPFSERFLREQFRVFAGNDNALLYTATHNGTALAQAFIIFYGAEAVYHYGASTEAGRKYPGAYLIQWEAIREAKRRGMLRYNFWGVARPEEKQHRFYRISIFKRGFGGEDIQYLHAQDLVLNPLRYAVNFAIESLRRMRRGV